MVPAVAYVGVGLVCHLLFMGSHLDPTSAWTWGWLIGWPFLLSLVLLGLSVGLGFLAAVGLAIWLVIEYVRDR